MPTINHNSVKTNRNTRNKITTNDNSAKYYNSSIWRNLRNSYYTTHPLCECCIAHHRVSSAQDCHHIIPFMQGRTEDIRWKLLGDEHNIMSLCSTCHSAIHSKIKKYRIQTGCSDLSEEEYNTAHNII